MSELEHRLVDLGEHLDVPTGDGLAAAVTAQLVANRRPVHHRRRWLVGAAAGLVTAAVVAPAVADRLDVGEVAVRQAPPPTTSTTEVLDLGERVTLTEAARVAGFTLLLPAGLGEPDEVWVDRRHPEPLVWLRWDRGPLLTEVAGHIPEEPALTKYTMGASVEHVRIGERKALWIAGAHTVAVHGVHGDYVLQEVRTSASTLLVEIGDVTVRIEAAGDRDVAIRIAESLPGT